LWGIGPEKWTNFPGEFYCVVNTEALQRLNVKHPIVKLAICTFVSVNAFALPKHLSSHKDSPFPRAASREILNRLSTRRDKVVIVRSSGASDMC
jgi:hypothetical protein